ncbi:hypothetical protein [Pandoraea pnomenusa]|uniref:Uncharacterized protein n=1 Tax=Pandoraea pnomenusa TaxID=93220 RepID=A0A378YPI5_9BURK|nr:hypothetical protein [Pandoraea pnomenusa]AHB08708.1 hypothetical protein U875_22715 [Pandoraea pnomenusa 3kgm]AHN77519.2 hypothetical protein DA70_15390 [Pandoraea pnomenusa]AIU27720.2 hypothetical protein LV28_15290 [Pandoraea pnomenusa]ANC44868.1 hypothetical protein A6P55_12390 [Pandoraea pnomenusa]QDH57976.1 hypothetical protein FKQ53_00805 [Pandoraea pnomenusa]
MASIHTQINAATMTSLEAEQLHQLICRHAIDPARTTVGVTRDGKLILLIGWSAYRHPRLWRRARDMALASLALASLPARGVAQTRPGLRAMRLDQPFVIVWLVRNASACVKQRVLQSIRRQLDWRGNPEVCAIDILEHSRAHDALSELKLRMGSAQNVVGHYKLLTERDSPYRDHYHRELPGSRERRLWVARQTALRAHDGTCLPASVVRVGGRPLAVVCQTPQPGAIEAYLGMLMTLRPPVVVHVTPQCEPHGAERHDGPIRVQRRHVTTSTAAEFVTDFSAYSTTLRSCERDVTFSVLHAPYRHTPDVPSDRLYVTQTLQFVENALRHMPMPDDTAARGAPAGTAGCPVVVFDDTDGIAGVLVAALALSRGSPEGLSVEEVVTDIRLTGSPQLIGTTHQLDVIGAFADDLRVPLLMHR